jgi:M6 family metalloprotease-like protein
MSLLHGAVKFASQSLIGSTVMLALLLVWAPPGYAVVANPHAFEETQPDGTVIALRVRGDEHFNWSEDLDGYTVVHNLGWFEYARLNPQGRLVPSGLRVGLDNPRAGGLKRGQLPSAAQRAASAKKSPSVPTAAVQAVAPFGSLRNLVVLVRFSNHVGRAVPSASEVNVLMNAPGGDPVLAPTGSVRDIYLQNSYGQFELNSDVTAWITVSGTEQYYANGVSGDSTLWAALKEALNALDGSVDFRQYDDNNDGYIDSITFLHSGYGAEWGATDAYGTASRDRIWSHKWVISPAWVSQEGVQVANYHISPALWGTSGSQIGRIGVIAHETGHFLGLPDLYDTDGGGAGAGSYDLMANSWGFDGTQKCPPQLSPWSKMQLGWIDPVDISASGRYGIGQSASDDDYYMISAGFPAGEYLLIENRQRAGLDCSLPQGGLAIWHIDDETGFDTEGYPGGRWPKDGKHYRVALAQADGNFQLEKGINRGDAGDLHHGAGVDAIAPGPDGHPNTDAYQDGRIV